RRCCRTFFPGSIHCFFPCINSAHVASILCRPLPFTVRRCFRAQSSGDATPVLSILIRSPLVGERSQSAAIQSGDASQLCAIDRVCPIYSHFQRRKSGSRSWFDRSERSLCGVSEIT